MLFRSVLPLVDRPLNLEQGPVLHEVLVDAQVHVVGQRLKDAVLQRRLHHVLKVVARLHPTVDQL